MDSADSSSVTAAWGGGEMAARVRAFDWSRTPLGPIGRWPQSLRIAVGICLNSRFPMFVWWGADARVNVYNDAYALILGARHPWALGRPAREIWGEIWDEVGRQADAVFHRGESTWNERRMLVLERNGYPEECYFTWSYSAIPDESGGVGGMFCAVSEETQRVRAEARVVGVLESITDAFFAVDWDWRFSYLNRQAERLLARAPGELLGRGVWAEYPSLIGSDFERAYRRAADERVAASVTAFYADHDRWYEVHAYPAPDGGISVYFRDVTDRKRHETERERLLAAERAARAEAERLGRAAAESERQYRLMVENVRDYAIFMTDTAGIVTRWNVGAERVLGWPEAEIVGRPAAQIFVPDDRDRGAPQREMDLARRDGHAADERWHQRRDGTRFFAQGMMMRVDDDAGRHVGYTKVLRDVTERRRAEQELADTRARAAAAVEAERALLAEVFRRSPSFMVVLRGPGHVFELVNERYLELIGPRAVIGKTVREALPEIEGQGFFEQLDRVYETGEPFVVTGVPVMLRRRAGAPLEERFIEFVYQAVRGADGAVTGIFVHGVDLTERKRDEARLARDATLLANVRDSVIVTDLSGVVTFWNEGATRLFGWTAEEMLGRPYAERLPEPARAEVSGWIARIAAGAGEFDGEWLDHRKDGSSVWIAATTRLIAAADGRPLGVMGVARDISDRKRAEAEREQLLASERAARAESERASRMKDEFLATLGHELRTPLNAILGWAHILKDGATDAQDLADGLATIERNARAQTQIIEDLLDMSRIISGKVRLDVQRVDLAAVVHAAVATAKPAADARGVRLQQVLDPQAGPVAGDPNRLQQVLWNLLSNAIKFTPRGGRVQVLLERVNSHVELSVTDTGEGIKPEFLPHVFDRFRQADASTTRKHGGLGLGLSIVKNLVELHGGTVRARSAGPGAGTTFVVTLPVTILHPEPHDEVERRHPSAEPPVLDYDACRQLEGLRVLVVDDEPDARSLVTRLLEDCDATVRAAASAAEALAMLAAEPPDVLVSDIGMPGEDGYSLIRRVRAMPADRGGRVPAVALTAYARSEDRMKALKAGFQMHVVKPVEPAELITVIASLSGRSG